MDDMRQRYRAPRRDYGVPVNRPAPARPAVKHEVEVPDALKHAYQPPPAMPEVPARPAEHIQPHHAARPVEQTYEPAPRRRRKSKKMWLILLFIIIIGLGGAGYYKFKLVNPFPAAIRQSATVSLYYPSKLPAGYKIDAASFNNDKTDIVTYAARKGSLIMVFTVEKNPANFDFNAFYKNQLKNSTVYQTAYGQGVVGQNDNRYIGSLVAGDTWVIISNNNPAVTSSDVALAMTNLKKY